MCIHIHIYIYFCCGHSAQQICSGVKVFIESGWVRAAGEIQSNWYRTPHKGASLIAYAMSRERPELLPHLRMTPFDWMSKSFKNALAVE